MRQVVSIFLLFSILVSSTGFTLAKHFCGETLAHITLSDEVKTCCGDGEEEKEMPDDCCHDEFDQLLLDDSQLNHATWQLQPLTYFTIRVLTQFLSFSPETTASPSPWTAFHSPPLPGISVYLRVQSFLI